MRDQCGGAAMYCINYTPSSSWETSTASLQPPETLSAVPNLRRSRRQAVAEREARPPQMWHGLAGRRGRAWLAPCSVADARPPPPTECQRHSLPVLPTARGLPRALSVSAVRRLDRNSNLEAPTHSRIVPFLSLLHKCHIPCAVQLKPAISCGGYSTTSTPCPAPPLSFEG